MSESFSIMPERLRGSGNDMATLGGRMRGQGGQLAGDASFWGADDPGGVFGAAYAELLQAATEALDRLVGGLDGIGRNLGVMADNHETVDRALAERFGRIAGQV